MNPSLLFALLLTALGLTTAAAAPRPPNIVWLVTEDMSPHLGCYGERNIRTPNLDRLAAAGTRFSRAFTTAPICSTSRSALITGMYQTTIGAHHHRSGRGTQHLQLPPGTVPLPARFREAGYLTLNLTAEEFLRTRADGQPAQPVGIAKTDYNFDWDEGIYDRTHWADRPAGQPFFVQVQLAGGKLRGHGQGTNWPAQVTRTLGGRTPPAAVVLPPNLPDHPVIREDWAQYLDTVRFTDWQVGQIVERLRAADELDRTVISFLTDHGVSHVRHKQFLYDGGTHIPLILSGPGITKGVVRSDQIEHIDLAAASLGLAGIPLPATLQARDFLSAGHVVRSAVFSARDRADETEDRIRSLRTAQFKYIRNHRPQRPMLQPNAYKDAKPIVQALRQLHADGALPPALSRLFAAQRPTEELYDLQNDPFELHNLAGEAAREGVLVALRSRLADWESQTGDRGRVPESREAYEGEMNLNPKEAGNLTGDPQFWKNVELMRRWRAEGR